MLETTINRVRRNHGLEHATIHVLSEKFTGFSAQGNSDHHGFSLNVYGDISEEEVATAVHEAYRRLRAGQRGLAVHPNCGTGLITTAIMATLAAQLVFGVENHRHQGKEDRLSVLFNTGPLAVLMVVLAIIVSRPLGMHLQERYTTDGNPGDLVITRIERVQPSLVTRLFQLLLVGGRAAYRPRAYRITTQG
jgi:hypothetical protein